MAADSGGVSGTRKPKDDWRIRKSARACRHERELTRTRARPRVARTGDLESSRAAYQAFVSRRTPTCRS